MDKRPPPLPIISLSLSLKLHIYYIHYAETTKAPQTNGECQSKIYDSIHGQNKSAMTALVSGINSLHELRIWMDASSCIRVSVQSNFFCAILPPLDHQHLWLCRHCPLNFSGQPIKGTSVVCISSELLSHTDKIHLRGVN